MELKTILHRVYQLPGFVYGKIRLVRAEEEGERDRLEVQGFSKFGMLCKSKPETAYFMSGIDPIYTVPCCRFTPARAKDASGPDP